jgi:hypothetical protein
VGRLILDFVARDRDFTKAVTARMALVALAVLIAAWTNPWHELFWGHITVQPLGELRDDGWPLFWINVTYTYAVPGADRHPDPQAIRSPYLYSKRAAIADRRDGCCQGSGNARMSRLEGRRTSTRRSFFACGRSRRHCRVPVSCARSDSTLGDAESR